MDKKLKHKLWLDRRSRKLQKRRVKFYGYGVSSTVRDNNKRRSSNFQTQIYNAKAPKCFSFIQNSEETIAYFSNILYEMKKQKYGQKFFLDSSEVTSVTADALIYILAILYNIKTKYSLLKYRFEGNLPNDKDAKRVYIESGFLKYVNTKRLVPPETENNVQIVFGKKTDTETSARICDFVNSKFNRNRLFTLGLYQTLIELMSNTVHHAYNNDHNITQPAWYLYAIYKNDSIQFTFIDTGEGIPKTVKRKISEKLIPMLTSDSDLIRSAFLGEARTETGLYNRGHGLPTMCEKVKNGKLTNFYVLSGKGNCILKKNGSEVIFDQVNYGNDIFGTIIQFDINNE